MRSVDRMRVFVNNLTAVCHFVNTGIFIQLFFLVKNIFGSKLTKSPNLALLPGNVLNFIWLFEIENGQLCLWLKFPAFNQQKAIIVNQKFKQIDPVKWCFERWYENVNQTQLAKLVLSFRVIAWQQLQDQKLESKRSSSAHHPNFTARIVASSALEP